MNDNFLAGFYKHAGVSSALGTLVGKAKIAPAVAGSVLHAAPAAGRAGVKAVGEQVAKNQRSFNVSKLRALGRSGRIGEGVKATADLSRQAQKGKIMTGVTSPAALKKAKGSLTERARNAAAAGTVGIAAGLHYGMKDKDENGVR
jgi:hypothetical protein